MNRKDWKAGMENEAASVEDAVWARETRLIAIRRHAWLDMALAMACALLMAISLCFMLIQWVNCRFDLQKTPFGCWINENPNAVDFILLTALLLSSLLLGMNRVRWQLGAAVFASVPLFNFLVAFVSDKLGWTPNLSSFGYEYHMAYSVIGNRSWMTAALWSLFSLLGLWLGGLLRLHLINKNISR